MTESGLSVVLATVLTTYIIQFFDINQSLYGPIYTGLDQTFRNMTFEYSELISYVTMKNAIIVGLMYVCYKYYTNVEEYIKQFMSRDKKYTVLNIYDANEIRTYLEYITYFKSFYTVAKQMEYGNPELKVKAKEYVKNLDIGDMAYYKKSVDGIKVYFNDTNYNVKGYYVWHRKDIKITKKEESYVIPSPYISIYLEDGDSVDVNNYYTQLSKKCDEMTDNTVEILHVKMLKDEGEIINNEYLIYDGEKKSLTTLEELYINPFFHKEKDRLWKIIKEIHFNPSEFYKFGQAPRIGLLLHGPPGTGKSTFAFRAAMALNRHIVSLDLRSIRNKHEIYRILRSPHIDGVKYEPKNVVYIFDEFDLTIRELHARKQQMHNIYSEWIRHINKSPKFNSSDEKTKRRKPVKKVKKPPRDLDTDDSENNSDSDESNHASSPIRTNRSYSIESFGYNTDDLSLEDLLEILQGPVPLEGSIIIATTNKYEEILELCPALFRPGRLTPVHFDSADNWLVNEITKYFFQQEYINENDIRKYNISPSYLIQIASESKFMDTNKYEYFISKLNEHINSKLPPAI